MRECVCVCLRVGVGVEVEVRVCVHVRMRMLFGRGYGCACACTCVLSGLHIVCARAHDRTCGGAGSVCIVCVGCIYIYLALRHMRYAYALFVMRTYTNTHTSRPSHTDNCSVIVVRLPGWELYCHGDDHAAATRIGPGTSTTAHENHFRSVRNMF